MKWEKDYGSISSLKKHFAEEHMGKCYTCDKYGKSFYWNKHKATT